MRVALFTYATQPRGGVLHALALTEALGDIGHDATLFALDDGRGFVRPPRCPTVRVPLDVPRGDLLAFVHGSIAAYVDTWNDALPRYDVYHAHDGISGNALATLTQRGRIPGFVRTVHHLDDFGATELGALHERSIVRASALFVVSALWRERVESRYGRPASVVGNGVDTQRFAPAGSAERARLRAQLGGAADAPLYVTIGGVEPRKNTHALLEAFARVRRTAPAARLIVAGGASIFEHAAYRRAFTARAAELGLAVGDGTALATAPITLTGVASDADIVRLLRAAHAFVFPSLVEGFGLVVLEAAACGTPVITSALRPFTDYLAPSDALLVDPSNPDDIAAGMVRALAPAVAARAAERGPAVARRFPWAAVARAHLAAYAAFAAGSREAVGA
jgi:glycosyltransferase-like protein